MTKPRCLNHPDDMRCAVKDSQDAAEIVLQAKTDADAAKLACEAIRLIMTKYGGILRMPAK
jgi:hypothetical protein